MRRPKFRASGAGCQIALSLPPPPKKRKEKQPTNSSNRHESSFELAATHRVYRMLPSVSLTRSVYHHLFHTPLERRAQHYENLFHTISMPAKNYIRRACVIDLPKKYSQKFCFDPLTDENVCEIFANRAKSLSFKVRPSRGNGNGLKLRSRRIQHSQTRTRTSQRVSLVSSRIGALHKAAVRHFDIGNRKQWKYCCWTLCVFQ